MSTFSASRLNQTRTAMAHSGADAFVITHLPNVYYLSGFSGSNALLLISADSVQLFTDGRYSVQARQEAPDARIRIVRVPVTTACGDLLRAQTARHKMSVAFESTSLNVDDFARLKKTAGQKVHWKPLTGVIEGIRELKDEEELDIMREAARLASEVVSEAPDYVRAGVTELDVAAEIDYRLRKKGASGPSFDIIVASGPRAALPHAQPTAKQLEKNELVVLDLGAILRHYCSDITRTVFLGRAPVRVRRWYKAVQQAHAAALRVLRDGVAAGSVDSAARRLLNQQGLGSYFVHGTGHGLGIEIHERPRLGRGQTQKIRAGQVVTIEPGIYVEGVGGIRLEDEVAVHSGGTELLTDAPRELLEL